MKAVAWTQYGPPQAALSLVELAKPTPKSNEVCIRVHASTVTAGDARLRGMNVPGGFRLLTRLVFGLFKPRKSTPGMEFSGEIEAVGQGVSSLQAGDRVFGTAGIQMGAHAEYLCLPETAVLIKKPDEVSHQDAVALIFGGQTALHFLKEKAGLRAGQRVLINGAAGAVGTAAVQLAKYLGAEVTAVCSTANIELVRSLGARHVIDYTANDVEATVGSYDVVLDAVGNLSLSRCKHLLGENGIFVAVSGGLSTNLAAIFKKNLISGVADESKAHLRLLMDLFSDGQFKPVVDRIYPLEQIVDAHAYVDAGHKKGNVVVTLVS